MAEISVKDREQARERQRKRYRDDAAKQYVEREHIRSEIPTRKIVIDLIQISEVLQQGYELIKEESGAEFKSQLDATRQQGLSKAAEIKFRLLNKTVPDLKQIELRADVTEEALPQAITFTIVKPYLDVEE